VAREAAGRQAGKRGAGKSATRESGGKRGRKGVYADIRVSPVTAILRKTFDLFAHAVANPEERLIPTRMLGMPRFPPSPPLSLSLSLSLPVHPRFIPRGVSVRDRELFGTPMDPGRFSACENSRKSNLVVGARPTTRSGVLPSVGNNDASEQRVFTNHRLS